MTEDNIPDLWGRVTELQMHLLCHNIDMGPVQGIINAQIEIINKFPPENQISMLQKIIQQLELFLA